MNNANLVSEEEIAIIKKEMIKNTGISIKNFKSPFLNRRIIARMMAIGVKQGSEYAKLLSEDPLEALTLYNSFSINVTEFFRNPSVWDAFATDIVPQIINNSKNNLITIWSAGCATGEEAYSLAIMFQEAIENKNVKFKVIGTDMNKVAVNIAKTGIYERKSLKNIPSSAISKYFNKLDDELYQVKNEIKDLIEFNRSDLGSQFIDNLDVIVCRNLLIYYSKEAQELLFRKFHQTMNKDGFLVLGLDETLIGTIGAKLFKATHSRERIFKKIDEVE